MQTWKLRAAVSGLKSLLPFQRPFRSAARWLKPYATNPANDIGLLGDALRQIDALRAIGCPLGDATIVEIGTGWKPILPILFRLCGVRRVITIDQERLLDLKQFQAALQYIYDNIQFVGQKTGISVDLSFDRITVDTHSLRETLDRSCIDYLAPFNFSAMPHGYADIIVSRAVLEHISEATLDDLMRDSVQILAPGGFMCHTIDMSDHWEHGDKSISRVNFLQYDDNWAWKFAGLNPQNYQNRLRLYEYVQLMHRHGFDVLSVSGDPNHAAMEALRSLPLCKRYKGIPPEELAILSSTIVARRPPSPAANVEIQHRHRSWSVKLSTVRGARNEHHCATFFTY